MGNSEIRNIIRLLENTFDGSAWHGPSILNILNEVNAERAFKEFDNIHSIAELVQHMTTWRKFAVQRLRGNHQYEIGEFEDWKKILRNDENTWREIKKQFLQSQQELLETLDGINDLKLTELVENKAYDYYTMLHGVIQHDIYHGGQISLLKKQ